MANLATQFDPAPYSKRIVRSMLDHELWTLRSWDYPAAAGLQRTLPNGNKMNYVPNYSMFRVSVPTLDIPDIRLGVVSGVVAFLIFKRRVRDERKKEKTKRTEETLKFLMESGV